MSGIPAECNINLFYSTKSKYSRFNFNNTNSMLKHFTIRPNTNIPENSSLNNGVEPVLGLVLGFARFT